MGAGPAVLQTVPRRTFEALFRPEGIPVTEPLRLELRSVGIDLEALQAAYPLTVLRQAMDVARRHAFPDLSEADGLRAVGRRFVAGFKQTPIGWVFRTMAPIFGADRTIQTLPRYMASVREDMPLEIVATGERRYDLSSADGTGRPDFMAGCLEAVLETCGVTRSVVTVTRASPDGFAIDIAWD
jgi:uncharacterized protein (TIGR02265 family)